MPAAQNTSNESRGVGARLAVGQHVKNKMTARPQVFVYPPQNQRQLANSEEVIQRKGIRSRQIHLARQPQAADVFEQEADVGRAAIARGNPEHSRRRINPKNRDSPTPAQIAREESGPAADIQRSIKGYSIRPHKSLKGISGANEIPDSRRSIIDGGNSAVGANDTRARDLRGRRHGVAG